MKSFLLKISIFIGLFLLVNIFYLLLARNLDWNYKKYLEAQEIVNDGYQVIVLGNSLAMDGINTEMIGSAYNLSIGGASLETSLFQLENYIQNASSLPETVILGLGSNIDLKRKGLHPIVAYTHSNKFDSFYDLPLLRFRWMAQEMLKRLISSAHRNAVLVQGQLRINRTKPDNSKYTDSVKSKFDDKSYTAIPELQEIFSICKDNNIRLYVLEMPRIKKEQNDIPVGPHSIASFTFFNFSNKEFCKIFDDKEHWLGGSHLNEAGAQVFTNAMLENLDL